VLRLDENALQLLTDSGKTTGQLQSGLNCLQHPDRILLGNYRKGALGKNVRFESYDVDALAFKCGITHDASEEVVRIHGDIHRRIRVSETKDRILTLAIQLQESGVTDEMIGTRLSQLVPYSQSYLDRLLPVQFKRRDHANSPGRPKSVVYLDKRVSCECCGLLTKVSTTPICSDCKRRIKLLSANHAVDNGFMLSQLIPAIGYIIAKSIVNRTLQSLSVHLPRLASIPLNTRGDFMERSES